MQHHHPKASLLGESMFHLLHGAISLRCCWRWLNLLPKGAWLSSTNALKLVDAHLVHHLWISFKQSLFCLFISSKMTWTISICFQRSCEGTSSKSFIQGYDFQNGAASAPKLGSRFSSSLPCGSNTKDFGIYWAAPGQSSQNPAKGQYIGSSQMAFPLSRDFSCQDVLVKQSLQNHKTKSHQDGP